MTNGDRYHSYAEIAQNEAEGVDYERILVERPGRVAILAPHGGGVEPGTSELARAVAYTDFSLYIFESLKADGSQTLHLTSLHFDEPLCIRLVERSPIIVTIHGCNGDPAEVYVGGRNIYLKNRVLEAFLHAGFAAIEDNSHHAGTHPNNICNRGKTGGGVQLEITEGLRREMFSGLTRPARQQKLPPFDRFVTALRTVLIPEK